MEGSDGYLCGVLWVALGARLFAHRQSLSLIGGMWPSSTMDSGPFRRLVAFDAACTDVQTRSNACSMHQKAGAVHTRFVTMDLVTDVWGRG